MTFIWATRGRSWGFRFLRDAGLADPLPEYDRAFSQAGDQPELYRRAGQTVALRWPDPAGRCDRHGRVIPHEFVVYPPAADTIHSVDDGRRLIWPQVAEEYEQAWAAAEPPNPTE